MGLNSMEEIHYYPMEKPGIQNDWQKSVFT